MKIELKDTMIIAVPCLEGGKAKKADVEVTITPNVEPRAQRLVSSNSNVKKDGKSIARIVEDSETAAEYLYDKTANFLCSKHMKVGSGTANRGVGLMLMLNVLKVLLHHLVL
ncbi:hypothetical protein CTI12_AA490040 [Artemisia annua]|uniref:Uncharacterized protein n=1 Tax=Artemisia annua TaxID=35608 RepID=A0A2U1LHI5_ARTAN|nr:hypothetical protein CTI12_AA490040 [Artemisia annua]